MLEMLKLGVEAKERSLTIATGSNLNNDRNPFHQPDFTTSALINLAARKQSACIAGLTNNLSHKCLKVTNKQERKTVLKTKNLCYICSEPGHVAKLFVRNQDMLQNFVARAMFIKSFMKSIMLVFAVMIHALL